MGGMKFNDLKGVVRSRRSIRKWKQEPVREDMVIKAMELATWAPNGGNCQNWKFVIVSNLDLIERMADAFEEKIHQVTSWPEAREFKEAVDRWRKKGAFFRYAPLCIAVFMSNYESLADRILKARAKEDGCALMMFEARRSASSGVQSVAAAVAYLLLGLHSQKLGAVWMTGPLLAKAQIEKILNVSKTLTLMALIAVGVPDEEPVQTRKPVSEVVEFRR